MCQLSPVHVRPGRPPKLSLADGWLPPWLLSSASNTLGHIYSHTHAQKHTHGAHVSTGWTQECGHFWPSLSAGSSAGEINYLDTPRFNLFTLTELFIVQTTRAPSNLTSWPLCGFRMTTRFLHCICRPLNLSYNIVEGTAAWILCSPFPLLMANRGWHTCCQNNQIVWLSGFTCDCQIGTDGHVVFSVSLSQLPLQDDKQEK